jgi:membrane-associated phospholipid phosphatase
VNVLVLALCATLAAAAAGDPSPDAVEGAAPPAQPGGVALEAPLPPPRLRLRFDPVQSGLLIGTSLALVGADLAFGSPLAPERCRACTPNAFDRSARDALRWRHPSTARLASDVGVVLVPALAVGGLGLAEHLRGDGRTFLEDVVVVTEAVSFTLVATQVVKSASGRARPYTWAGSAPSEGTDDLLSFWSGHSAAAFTAVTAAATVARLRGDPLWRWILGVGLAGASTVAWLRVAADRHWATDVLAGAVAGSAVGIGLPLLLRVPRQRAVGLRVFVGPGVVAGVF